MSRIPKPRREGFTLVELLVVLAIVGIIVSLSAAAAVQVITYQRRSNTSTLIRSLSTILNRQWAAVIAQAKQERIPDFVVTNIAEGDLPRARVIYIKLRLKQEFPMNFNEALNGPLPARETYKTAYNQAYADALVRAGIPITAPPYPVTNTPQDSELADGLLDESSALLLLALQQGRAGISFTAESLPPGSTVEGAYYSPDPALANYPLVFKQMVDAWGKPLKFYRWPTANPDVNALDPAALQSRGARYRDLLDPEGTLMNQTWWSNNAGRKIFEAQCHSVSLANGSAPASYYTIPTIASRGRNGLMGMIKPVQALLPDPMQPDGLGNDNDNINSFRLREGATGD